MSPDSEDPQQGRQRPLHAAAYHDAAEAAALLIERGAEVDHRDAGHEATPLWFAIWDQRPRTIALLSRHSRDVGSLVFIGDVARLREVLNTEPDLAKRVNRNGQTLLMGLPDDETAALAVTELLLEHGTDATRRDPAGLTAADRAQQRGLDRVAARLREAEQA